MRLAIVGSRDFKRLDLVAQYVGSLPQDTVIVSGGARGVDSVAVAVAKRRGMSIVVYEPDYTRYGRYVAPKIRNFDIAKYCDSMVCFWNADSTGSTHAVAAALWLGKPVEMKVEPTLFLPTETRQGVLFEG